LDEASSQPKQHIRKLRLYAKTKEERVEAISFGMEKSFEHKLMKEKKSKTCTTRKKGKYDNIPTSFINNVCKTLRGTIVILYKGGSSSL
jgi:predicted phage tail protein